MQPFLDISSFGKTFTLHTQNGSVLEVLKDLSFSVDPGEAVALCGPSGSGKSSVLKAIYGTYRISHGHIHIRDRDQWLDIATASARDIQVLRTRTVGYVSQFLRAVPRIPAIDVVAEPAILSGTGQEQARSAAATLLSRLNIPDRLHSLSPLTFSGGEQQRVNIARAMSSPKPLMLFDEPTASLDPENRSVVVDMIERLCSEGHAVLAIFHDETERHRLAAREIQVTRTPVATHA